jgi:ketosteroid isomerase-like protein
MSALHETSSTMNEDIEDVDRRFFAALLAADADALRAILTDDFVLVDVMRGSEVTRDALIEAVGARQISFELASVIESRVRRYGDAAIVVGRTEMGGRAGAAPWAAKSRYTHVFVLRGGAWRLASAQGTPIADA